MSDVARDFLAFTASRIPDDADLASETLKIDVACEIQAALDEKELDRTTLAKKLGKKKSYVTRMLGGEQNLTLETIAHVFFALDMKANILREPRKVRSQWLHEPAAETIRKALPAWAVFDEPSTIEPQTASPATTTVTTGAA